MLRTWGFPKCETLVSGVFWLLGWRELQLFCLCVLPYITLTDCDVMWHDVRCHDVINDEKVFHCASEWF